MNLQKFLNIQQIKLAKKIVLSIYLKGLSLIGIRIERNIMKNKGTIITIRVFRFSYCFDRMLSSIVQKFGCWQTE